MLRKPSIVVAILFLTHACTYPSQDSSTLLVSTGGSDIDLCAADISLAFAINAASEAFSLIGTDDDLVFAALGEDGSQQLAVELMPSDTFCSLAVSPETQAVLDQIELLVDSGETEKASNLLTTLLADLRTAKSGAKLLTLRLYAAGGARQTIADLLAAGDKEISFGLGDGQGFFDAADSTFRNLAESELPNASIDESMRLAEEAQRLGQEDIANDALKRASDIMGEDLDAAIEDFDSCLPNDKILEGDIRNLLKKLAQAIVLGVPGSFGPGNSRYDAVMSKVWRAAQRLNPEAAMTLPQPDIPPPECEATYELEIDIHTVCPEVVEECYEESCVQKGTFRYQTEIQIAGRIPLTISAGEGSEVGASLVQSEGELDMTGEGLLGLCTLTGGEGTAQVTVSGNIESGATSHPSLDLALDETWYHTWTGMMTCPDSGSRSWDMPPLPNRADVSLRLEDGSRFENTEHIDTPFVCDTTYTYTLHVSNAQ